MEYIDAVNNAPEYIAQVKEALKDSKVKDSEIENMGLIGLQGYAPNTSPEQIRAEKLVAFLQLKPEERTEQNFRIIDKMHPMNVKCFSALPREEQTSEGLENVNKVRVNIAAHFFQLKPTARNLSSLNKIAEIKLYHEDADLTKLPEEKRTSEELLARHKKMQINKGITFLHDSEPTYKEPPKVTPAPKLKRIKRGPAER